MEEITDYSSQKIYKWLRYYRYVKQFEAQWCCMLSYVIMEIGQYQFRKWLVVLASSHCPNQCWSIVNNIIWNKHQWNFNQNAKFSGKSTHLTDLATYISISPFIWDDITRHKLLVLGIWELSLMNAVSISLAIHELCTDKTNYSRTASHTTYTSNHCLQCFLVC